MTGTNRAIVERWCGTIRSRQEADYSSRFERLGNAYGVALEVCQIRLADFRLTATDVSSADDRVSHANNLKAAEQQLEALVGFISSSADISLSGESAVLLESALGDRPTGLKTVTVSRPNPRND